MLMSTSRKVQFRFFKDYFEGEVLEENLAGKDIFPDIEELHGYTYTSLPSGLVIVWSLRDFKNPPKKDKNGWDDEWDLK